jgi:hypothetical protein
LLKEAQQLQKQGGQPGNQNARKGKNGPCVTRAVSLGENTNAAYIRARLERDGQTELLAQVASGEISAHAAAIQAGFRQRMISHRMVARSNAKRCGLAFFALYAAKYRATKPQDRSPSLG